MHKPQSKAALHGFIGTKFNLWLPDKSFTPGHSTPFDFVANAFFSPARHLAAWANRSGLKTLCSSVIAALDYLFIEQKIHSRVLSGSEDQARNLYRYWENWCYGVLAPRVIGRPQKLLTRLDNGELRIIAASPKKARGDKVQRIYYDELDEMDPEIHAASIGMLDSRGEIQARSIATSTWHHPAGPMGQLVAEAEKRDIKLHKWGVWESIENCPVGRHDQGRNCEVCSLGEVCLAKARQRDPRATIGIAHLCRGLFAIDDAITQIQHWSRQQWEAEAECKRPTLEGTVYPQFDRAIHVVGDLDFLPDAPTYRAIDFGLKCFVCLWIQEDKHGHIYVMDEYWSEQNRLADNCRDILRIEKEQSPDGAELGATATFVDPAGRNRSDQTGYSDCDILRAELHQKPTYKLTPWAREVANGIQLIRGALEPASGKSRVSVSSRCETFIKAMESQRLRKVNGIYIDDPVKPQPLDHGPDAFRYYFVNRHSPDRWSERQWSATGA